MSADDTWLKSHWDKIKMGDQEFAARCDKCVADGCANMDAKLFNYARAMASYGTFISAGGFEYHGPKGHLGFAPKLRAANFKAPFTTAQGWGTFSQQYSISFQRFHQTHHIPPRQRTVRKSSTQGKPWARMNCAYWNAREEATLREKMKAASEGK